MSVATFDLVPREFSTDREEALLTADIDVAELLAVSEVPGTGPVRGIGELNGVVYAIRDFDAAEHGAAYAPYAAVWRSTNDGWVLASHRFTLDFRNGSKADGEPTTLPSFPGFHNTRVVTRGGSWEAGTATGVILTEFVLGLGDDYIETSSVNAAFTAGTATFVIDVDQSLSYLERLMLPKAGGRWEFIRHNFFGQSETESLYGASGAGPAMQIDQSGTVIIIPTGIVADRDTPQHIAAFKNHLFLGVRSSILGSAPGNPYRWTAIDGAFEAAMGDDVTGLMPQPGSSSQGSMAVFTNEATEIIYGNSALDFALTNYNSRTGAIRHSVQRLDDTYSLDGRGVFALSTTLAHGNFRSNSITEHVHRWLESRLGFVIGSAIAHDIEQYRLYFATGEAMYLTIVNGKLLGAMPMEFSHTFHAVHRGSDGVTYAAGTAENPHVFVLDSGYSFGGRGVDAEMKLSPLYHGLPRFTKQYRRAEIDVENGGYDELEVVATVDGDVTVRHRTPLETSRTFKWDMPPETVGVKWDAGTQESKFPVPLLGTGREIVLAISSDFRGRNGDLEVRSILFDWNPAGRRVL